jgi:arylsulfatase
MLKAFADVGEADNTLVFYIAGDNGTSGEGGQNGSADYGVGFKPWNDR